MDEDELPAKASDIQKIIEEEGPAYEGEATVLTDEECEALGI